MSKTRAQIASEITSNFPDNTTGTITPALLRTTVQDISDAAPNTADGDIANFVSTSTTVNGHALSANVTVSASDVGLGNVDNTSDATKLTAAASVAYLGDLFYS